MESPNRTKLNEKIENFNRILDSMKLDPNAIKITNCNFASVSIPLLSRKITEIHEELTLQYELEVYAMKSQEGK